MAHSTQNFTTANSDPATGVSICIPRVFNNIGWRRIKQVFIDLQWGYVERVDVIPKGEYKRAFVHFAPGKWNMSDKEACDVLAALKAGTEVKIVYDEPWYWKISLSRAKKPAEAPKPKARPTVCLGDAKEDQPRSATPPPTNAAGGGGTKAPTKIKVSRRAARRVAAVAAGMAD